MAVLPEEGERDQDPYQLENCEPVATDSTCQSRHRGVAVDMDKYRIDLTEEDKKRFELVLLMQNLRDYHLI